MEGNGEKFNLSGGSAGDGSRSDPPAKRIKTAAEEGGGAIELDLGLSTNGQFGVDRERSMNLERSLSGDVPPVAAARGNHAPPLRAASLPAGVGGIGAGAGSRSDPSGKGKAPMMYSPDGTEMNGDDSGGADVQYLGTRRGVGVQFRGTGGPTESPPFGTHAPPPPPSQGANQNTMVRNSDGPQGGDEASPAAGGNLNGKQKLLTDGLLNMPNVTLVPSPNHRQIEGILYRYRKAEELKIVCVCHGMFLTPAEFIKHGGGGDVEDPLKHIVVNPSPVFPV